ncbi:hypothetical protein IJO12_08555, partial [bacterium]|nr:hypothetical protein [bacterium]
AESKSQIIVTTAQTEAERIIEESRQRALGDCDAIKQKAYEEGFQQGLADGLKQFNQDAVDALKSIDTLVASNFEIKKNIIDSATLDIVELISAIADKVCHIKFDDEVLKRITIDAIRELTDKENITIIVNPKLVNNINSLVNDFRNEFANLENIKILEDNSVSPDGVIVETLNTRLDSSISGRINTIVEQMLMSTDDGME